MTNRKENMNEASMKLKDYWQDRAERARADKATEALALMVEAVERHADPTDPKHKRRLIQSPRLQEAMALARAALADLAASGEAQR